MSHPKTIQEYYSKSHLQLSPGEETGPSVTDPTPPEPLERVVAKYMRGELKPGLTGYFMENESDENLVQTRNRDLSDIDSIQTDIKALMHEIELLQEKEKTLIQEQEAQKQAKPADTQGNANPE